MMNQRMEMRLKRLMGALLALPLGFGIALAAPAPTPSGKPADKPPPAKAPEAPPKVPGPVKPQEKPPEPKAAPADAVFPYQLPAGFKREDLKKLKGAGWAQCDKIAEGLADACQLDGTYWQLDLGRFSTNLVELRFFKNVLWGVTIKKRDLLECGETQGAFYDAVNALRAGAPSIGTRSEGDAIVIGVWMMQPGEEKIVARRLRQVLEASPARAK